MIELAIEPFTQPASGTVSLPGSKSITNRAIILAALSDGPVTIRNALFSDDTRVMLIALKNLGFNLTTDEVSNEVNIIGLSGEIPCEETRINVGNAGTAARFLTALISLKEKGNYHLDGDDAMQLRPMGGLLDALISQGAEVEYEGKEGHFPFTLKTHRLKGGAVEINASASSQFLSALLMVAPFADQDTTIKTKSNRVRKPFVYLTQRMMHSWGQRLSTDKNYEETTIAGQGCYHYDKEHYDVEPDITAASYFIVLPLLTGGEVKIKGIKLDDNSEGDMISQATLQGDAKFIDILMSANLISTSKKSELCFQSGSSLKGIEQDFNEFSDTFLTLAAIAPLLEDKTRITGIGHTRQQETDRISAVATELRKLNQEVIEEEDALEVRPNRNSLIEKAREGVTIETYKDHRIAMSFAILGCANFTRERKPVASHQRSLLLCKNISTFFRRSRKNTHKLFALRQNKEGMILLSTDHAKK